MAEMLLINPRRRRATSKRRVHRRTHAVAAPRRHRRRRNPLENPIGLRRLHARRRRHVGARRRRNPIAVRGLGRGAIMQLLQNAMLGGAGAVAVDVLMGQIKGFLPAAMQRTPGKIGVGDAVKAAITIAAGEMLNKPTRGMSRKMATGALTCQMRDMIASFVPVTMQLGYASPARIVTGSQRVGPLAVGAYNRQHGSSPSLSAYSRSGLTPALSGMVSARSREGARYR